MSIIESIKNIMINDKDNEDIKMLFDYELAPKYKIFDGKPYNRISKKEFEIYKTLDKQIIRDIYFFMRAFKYATEEAKDEFYKMLSSMDCVCNFNGEIYDKIKKNVEYNIAIIQKIRGKNSTV